MPRVGDYEIHAPANTCTTSAPARHAFADIQSRDLNWFGLGVELESNEASVDAKNVDWAEQSINIAPNNVPERKINAHDDGNQLQSIVPRLHEVLGCLLTRLVVDHFLLLLRDWTRPLRGVREVRLQ